MIIPVIVIQKKQACFFVMKTLRLQKTVNLLRLTVLLFNNVSVIHAVNQAGTYGNLPWRYKIFLNMSEAKFNPLQEREL